MKKEVYDRKPRQPFAHQRELNNNEPVMKGAELTSYTPPTVPVIKPRNKLLLAWAIAKAVFAIGAIAYTIGYVAVLIRAAMEH